MVKETGRKVGERGKEEGGGEKECIRENGEGGKNNIRKSINTFGDTESAGPHTCALPFSFSAQVACLCLFLFYDQSGEE